jgi:hypothetical protein
VSRSRWLLLAVKVETADLDRAAIRSRRRGRAQLVGLSDDLAHRGALVVSLVRRCILGDSHGLGDILNGVVSFLSSFVVMLWSFVDVGLGVEGGAVDGLATRGWYVQSSIC